MTRHAEGEDLAEAKVHVTYFKNHAATTLTTENLTLMELRERVLNASNREKGKLPWLKLAIFGKKRSDENSLRHDANVLHITGIEVDYDEENIAFDDALKAVGEMGISALVYTSPSHSLGAPRWRILAPTSQPHPPAMRAKLVARVNGLLKMKLGAEKIAASESFTLSQAYFYGWVMKKPGLDHRAEVIIGDFIDLRDDLAEFEPLGAKTADETSAGESDPFADYSDRSGPKRGKSDEELLALLKQSRATPGKGWREPMLLFIGSTVGKGWSDLQIKLACAPYSDGGINDRDIQDLIDYTRKSSASLRRTNRPLTQPATVRRLRSILSICGGSSSRRPCLAGCCRMSWSALRTTRVWTWAPICRPSRCRRWPSARGPFPTAFAFRSSVTTLAGLKLPGCGSRSSARPARRRARS